MRFSERTPVHRFHKGVFFIMNFFSLMIKLGILLLFFFLGLSLQTDLIQMMEGDDEKSAVSVSFKKAAEQESRQCQANKKRQKFNLIIDIIDISASLTIFLLGLAGSLICKTGFGGTVRELETLYIPFVFANVSNGCLAFLSSIFRKF